jgi:hypothetical protein
MTVCLRKSGKAAAVRVPVFLLLSLLRSQAEDTFGANDADWAIYRKIVGFSLRFCRLFIYRPTEHGSPVF